MEKPVFGCWNEALLWATSSVSSDPVYPSHSTPNNSIVNRLSRCTTGWVIFHSNGNRPTPVNLLTFSIAFVAQSSMSNLLLEDLPPILKRKIESPRDNPLAPSSFHGRGSSLF